MKLEWSEQARRDIQEIIDYHEPIAGIKVTRNIVQKIYGSAQYLVNDPLVGQRELLLEDYNGEYRRLISGNYKILYRIDKDVIYISTVFDCRRNPVALRESVVTAEV